MSTTTKVPARRPEQYIGERVRAARKDKDWLQSDLVKRLEELGYRHWRQSKVAKIETGDVKRLSLEDVIALAVALGVQLPHLLAPDEGEVQVTPKLTLTGRQFKQWARGFVPLRPEDERIYFTGRLVPTDEWKDFVTGVGRAGAAMVAPGVLIETDAADVLQERFGEESGKSQRGEEGSDG